ncbi:MULTISPECIES: cbb3-type cytochrome oxidase assembly protein CcoS [unclassified Flavobacterium]|uniref:cbb3-type cytochrome oxidase assembly protein CcoS n=1 Tax=unclassified Flavobacterium TaxID=196869 RepID=UPI000F0C8055|nr:MULTISPECIES: cbb3-type cytochrome oxidase assembly protein CcoS [unclassified Flavobacterium]AYN03275.1 cbb3-type cytochrome oxidase assembly protein CcoS [Flavobacterium sp. 140616W15]MCD0474807.1 cbb3-type cytochrome oxidase assembly protein CcoS [Flavobacterium sp. EDS]
MSVIYLLISVSIFIAIGFFIAFVVAVKKGQYDDDYTPSVRMLFDDEIKKNPSGRIKTPNNKIKITTEKQI